MFRPLRPSLESLGSGLAAVGLCSTDGLGRSYVARVQGQAIILLPAARSARLTARTVFGLSRSELHFPIREITVPSEPLSTLEEEASEGIGTRVTVAGLRFGAGGLGKLTVGFVAQQRPLAFAKFPLTGRAAGSLAHEVETIDFLDRFDRLSCHLPDVISGLELGGTEGALFSSGPVGRVRWPSEEVTSFLSTLHELTARRLTIRASGLIDSWLEGLETRRALLGSTRSSTLEDAIRLVQGAIGQVPIEHTVAHGDFTRWNLRKGAGGLFVFDWEASSRTALPYHDLFHFFAADSALLHRPSPISYFNARRIRAIAKFVSPEWIPLQLELYLAYLVQTTLWYGEVRDWDSQAKPGRFWRFLWAELAQANKATRLKGG